MNFFIFGGSGFIGGHLINLLKNEVVNEKDSIYVLDIVMPGEKNSVSKIVEKIDGIRYIRTDVRKPIELDINIGTEDIIFNLAAVHRTPGHPDNEYFETNILGAENVTAFAENHGIRKILFTSSISPYGASEELKEETSIPKPNTPYGISKLMAEKIHEIWQARDTSREMTILRPGVVFGIGENGNFTRLYWGQRNRYFFYPGRKDTIKACIYVKELVRFMKHRMIDNSYPGVDIYNCTFEPAFSVEQICIAMQKATEMKRYIPLIPAWLLIASSTVLGSIGGKKVGLHPERVKKLMISTNISGKKLAKSDYQFQFSLDESLKDWYLECQSEGLF